MKAPFRARYGAQDRGHHLLSWDGPGRPPSALGDLTDRPPGVTRPSDVWWPVLGCGPLGDWWAVWWTVPDQQASRKGMVSSQALLWPLTEVGQVGDLAPFLAELGADPLPPIDSALLSAVAGQLLGSEPLPGVVVGLESWPSLVVALWKRLWPAVRSRFSARVALSPPQSGESVDPPWLYAVPTSRAPEWVGHRIISPGATQPGRAARWLMGTADPTLAEVVGTQVPLGNELGTLRRAARVADLVDRLREDQAIQPAVQLLQELSTLAPNPTDAGRLKAEALTRVKEALPTADLETVRMLRNIKPSALPEGLEPALTAWLHRQAPALPLDAAVLLLREVEERRQGWWGQGLTAALSRAMDRLDAAAAWLLPWWAATEGRLLDELIPRTAETTLLTAAEKGALGDASLTRLRSKVRSRGWSTLHAWTLQALPAQHALRDQLALGDLAGPGLDLLVDRLPAPELVEEAVAGGHAAVLRRLPQRTVKQPSLLASLDPRVPGWRALWAAHLSAGGAIWPPGVDRAVVCGHSLDVALRGQVEAGLLTRLAPELGQQALVHAERARLWAVLEPQARSVVLAKVAELVVRDVQVGVDHPEVEAALAEAVLEHARRNGPFARLIATLVQWPISLDEKEVVRWLDGPRAADWAPVAVVLGRAVARRGWEKAADRIYDLQKWKSELYPAAMECRALLSKWQRYWLEYTTPGLDRRQADPKPLIERIAELGASLKPDGLDDFWQRVGGKPEQLTPGRPDARWRDAVLLAHRGALEGGLLRLVKGLLEELPGNDDLKEVRRLLEQ